MNTITDHITEEDVHTAAKGVLEYPEEYGEHEGAHNSSLLTQVKLVYIWFDTQDKNPTLHKSFSMDKHFVEEWCGTYILREAVEIASKLHPEIMGTYYGEKEGYNISYKLLIKPHWDKLKGLNIHDASHCKEAREQYHMYDEHYHKDENKVEEPFRGRRRHR